MDISTFDKCALLFIQENLRFDALTPLMIFITKLGDNGFIWYVIVATLLINKNTRKTGKYSLISLALCAAVGEIIKHTVMRPRPFVEIPELITLVARPESYSFPSLHTVCGFAIAFVVLKFCDGKKRYALLIFAALMALSRPYVGVHYVTDVWTGFIVAVVGSCVVIRLATKKN